MINSEFDFEISDKLYKVIIQHKNIKRMLVSVNISNEIIVTVNKKISLQEVKNVLEKNIKWLTKQIHNNQLLCEEIEPSRLLKKEEVLFLGKRCKLVFDEKVSGLLYQNGCIYFGDDKFVENNLYLNLFSFYKDIIIELYNLRIKDCKVRPNLKIKPLKSKWGSYNRNSNIIILNLYLLFFNEDVINYVIEHEISHIYVFNHSKRFYDVLSKECPNYLLIKKQMRILNPLIKELVAI